MCSSLQTTTNSTFIYSFLQVRVQERRGTAEHYVPVTDVSWCVLVYSMFGERFSGERDASSILTNEKWTCVYLIAVTQIRWTRPTSFTPATGFAVTWKNTPTPACLNKMFTRHIGEKSVQNMQSNVGKHCSTDVTPCCVVRSAGSTVKTCSRGLWVQPTSARSSETSSPTSRLAGWEAEASPNILYIRQSRSHTAANSLLHSSKSIVTLLTLGWVLSLFLDHVGVTYCYSGIRRKPVLNMPLLPNLDLKNDPVWSSAHTHTFVH